MKRKYTDEERERLGISSRKNKKREGEPTKKKKRRFHLAVDDWEEQEEEEEIMDIEEGIRRIITHALEVEDWPVSDMVELLAGELKFIVREYE